MAGTQSELNQSKEPKPEKLVALHLGMTLAQVASMGKETIELMARVFSAGAGNVTGEKPGGTK